MTYLYEWTKPPLKTMRGGISYGILTPNPKFDRNASLKIVHLHNELKKKVVGYGKKN